VGMNLRLAVKRIEAEKSASEHYEKNSEKEGEPKLEDEGGEFSQKIWKYSTGNSVGMLKRKPWESSEMPRKNTPFS